MESKAEHIHVHVVNGVLVPSFVTQEQFDKLKDFPVRADDIWVVTYPKAGTTWTQQIVKLARNGGHDDDKNVSISIPWLEAMEYYPEIDINDLPTPRAFKSHTPYEMMPCGLPHKTPGRYIYVARNPKDVAVSLYHWNKTLVWGDPTQSWNDHFEKFISGDVYYGNYFDHVLSWWSHRHEKNILFLKFEEMKKDLVSAVTKIVQFIGLDLDQETIGNIVSKTTFEAMKDNPLANHSWNKIYVENRTPFMRKGIVGDWKTWFSEEQSKRIDAIYLSRCKPAGLELDFEI